MTATTIEQLERHIEEAIRAHIAEVRRRAAAAVERAFATARGRTTGSRAKARPPGRRRSSEEIGELAEQLFRAVSAQPGATMATLAAAVGVSAVALSRPVALLKRAGRVRSAGQRQATRYFPMTPRSAR